MPDYEIQLPVPTSTTVQEELDGRGFGAISISGTPTFVTSQNVYQNGPKSAV